MLERNPIECEISLVHHTVLDACHDVGYTTRVLHSVNNSYILVWRFFQISVNNGYIA